jgi:hypothetical protein
MSVTLFSGHAWTTARREIRVFAEKRVGKKSNLSSTWMLFFLHSQCLSLYIHNTTVPTTIVPWKKSGIYPLDRGICPRTICIKLDLCICTIPTVGLYGKLGEVTATHNRTSRMNCCRHVSTAALRRLYCRQLSLLLPMDPTAADKCCRGHPHSGGEACQY